ncbi:MAG: sugar ABC transporter ATP-binding protein [Acidimicrobiia bacterium]
MTEVRSVMEIQGVHKRFDATQALSDVSLEVVSGEVHAIVGENGAGKSTLIKIMTGIFSADQGTMTIDGEVYAPRGAAEAQRSGVAAIYQEPSVFPDLSVAENIYIGHQDRTWLVDRPSMIRDAEKILATLDIDINPRLPAAGLTVAGQQAVEIAKAISLDVRVLIMDEPTAALSAHEVDRLLRQVRKLKESGVAVLFITHRLEEVFAISDRISVFRDGRRISTRSTSEVTVESLVKEMVGRDPADFFAREDHPTGEVVLRVESLGRDGVFSDISFELHRGEVLGFAGLVGSGRTDIALALFGVAPADTGTVMLEGTSIDIRTPKEALHRGIAYLSEDRRRLGLSMPQSVTANVTLATLDRYRKRFGLLDRAKEREDAASLSERLGIRTPTLATPVSHLSGGNQQKTMLAKWLNARPKVLILDEPTRGIDVGSKADVHRYVDELARSGIAIILISSDLPEVIAVSDRVAVLREGNLMGIYSRSDATQERIMARAVGTS